MKTDIHCIDYRVIVAPYATRWHLEEMGIQKGLTSGTLIFTVALVISYLVALAVDTLAP